MELKDVASVSGKGGLFKVLKPTRTGVILESIDEEKKKLIASANTKVSVLNEISIYTTGKDSTIPLEDVLYKIFDKYQKSIAVNAKSEPAALAEFMKSVVPDYDAERVYLSDIKKLVSWYSIIAEHYPELLEKKKESKKEDKEAGTEKTTAKTTSTTKAGVNKTTANVKAGGKPQKAKSTASAGTKSRKTSTGSSSKKG